MKHVRIFIFLSLAQCMVLAAPNRFTELSGAWLNISSSGNGSEFNLLHREPIDSRYSISLGGTRADRYGLNEIQGRLGLQVEEERSWSLGVSGGYSSEGRILPKFLLLLEGQRAIGDGFSPVIAFRRQTYIDASVNFFTLGLDFEPNEIPWLFLTRSHLTQTKFDSIPDSAWNLSSFLKVFYTGLPFHRFFAFAAYGGEGLLQGSTATSSDLTSWSSGLGVEKDLRQYLVVKCSFDYQKYISRDLTIARAILGLEFRW